MSKKPFAQLELSRNFKIHSVTVKISKFFNRATYTPSRLAKVFVIAFFSIALLAPMNFVLIVPGDASPLFPKVLSIEGAKSYPVKGQLYLLTIYVTNPDSYVFGGEVLGCWIKQDCVAYPRSILYAKDATTVSEVHQGKFEMKQSQSGAVKAAIAAAQKIEPSIPSNVITDSNLKVDLKKVGGPSGGLIFALALTDLLTPQDLMKGRSIAGSGTISADGKVGAIGGISEKILAAKKTRASILFASKENCDEIPKRVTGITVVAISRLNEAVKYLEEASNAEKSSDFKGVLGCTNLSA